uniref:Transposase n=1 Tax=Vibrio lentus TaxID=136468 RepID=A0AB36XSK0_9VIBR|nr:hypothetical protein BCT99_12120 [Vibrio lentus]
MGKSKKKIANWTEYNEALCKRGSVRHIAINSTGMKVFGEGEWKVKKHGAEKRSVNCIWPLMSIPMMLLAQKSASSMLVIAKLSQHY